MSKPTKYELESFALSANGFFGLNQSDQIDYFVYFLTVKMEMSTTQATSIRECFFITWPIPISNISQYLNTT